MWFVVRILVCVEDFIVLGSVWPYDFVLSRAWLGKYCIIRQLYNIIVKILVLRWGLRIFGDLYGFAIPSFQRHGNCSNNNFALRTIFIWGPYDFTFWKSWSVATWTCLWFWSSNFQYFWHHDSWQLNISNTFSFALDPEATISIGGYTVNLTKALKVDLGLESCFGLCFLRFQLYFLLFEKLLTYFCLFFLAS